MHLTAAAAPGGQVTVRLVPATLGALILLLPLHELLPAACCPEPLRSRRVVLGLWPRALLLYVYLDGALSRARMAGVSLCPWTVLGAATWLAALAGPARADLWLGAGALHAAACGVDLLAALLLLPLPRGARLRNHGWQTYWRPPDGAPAAASPP